MRLHCCSKTVRELVRELQLLSISVFLVLDFFIC